MTAIAPLETAGDVLVIDNDAAARELLRRALTKEGFAVRTAADGTEGIRLARETRPRAILLDVDMPVVNGWSVLTSLKSDPDLSAVPVIMVTMMDERTKGKALGASDYLVKPVDRTRLATVLRQHDQTQTVRVEGPPRVLIVEDDAANREILSRLLTREGCVVVEAENGQAALDRVHEQAPALILLDLMMPVMDGFTFLIELHKNVAHRSIPVVILTAKDLTDAERRRLSLVFGKVLQKGSYRRDELLRELNLLLGNRS